MDWKIGIGSGKFTKGFQKPAASPWGFGGIQARDLAAAVSIMEDRTPCV
jgi:hypothetical protein